jgi:hypothetical protein
MRKHLNSEQLESRLNWDEVRARMIKLSRRKSDNRKVFRQLHKLTLSNERAINHEGSNL